MKQGMISKVYRALFMDDNLMLENHVVIDEATA